MTKSAITTHFNRTYGGHMLVHGHGHEVKDRNTPHLPPSPDPARAPDSSSSSFYTGLGKGPGADAGAR